MRQSRWDPMWRGPDPVRQAGVRVCVWALWACACVSARRVFGRVPQRLGHDANATSPPRRGVAAHGEAVAGAWRGLGGLGSVHARTWVLDSQGRGMTMPCVEHRHPRPAAQRGAGEATTAVEKTAARWVPARKGGTAAGGGIGGPTAGLRRAHRRR
jgi:hypothetical protein